MNRNARFAVMATYASGIRLDVTDRSVLRTNTSIATLGRTGFIVGNSVGTTTLVASFEGQTATATIIVSDATAVALEVSPPSVTIETASVAEFKALTRLDDGTFQQATLDATWTASSPSVAVVNGGEPSRWAPARPASSRRAAASPARLRSSSPGMRSERSRSHPASTLSSSAPASF